MLRLLAVIDSYVRLKVGAIKKAIRRLRAKVFKKFAELRIKPTDE